METNRVLWTRLLAIASFVLAANSWLLAIVTWGWFLTRPPGAFGEMGGVMFIVYIFPISLGVWIVGGPIALALGGYAAKRVRSGAGTAGDGTLARVGIWLSRAILWMGVGLLLISFFLGMLRSCVR